MNIWICFFSAYICAYNTKRKSVTKTKDNGKGGFKKGYNR